MSTKRVYLAGPDVFFKNARQHAEALKAICASHGLAGVFPLDADLNVVPGSPASAHAIKKANIGLIRSCRGVLANLMPFRGPSADVGTAWEMGFATALNLPIVGYTPADQNTYYARRVRDFNALGVAEDEYEIEDFGLVDNLMLVSRVDVCSTFEDAARCMAVLLGAA